ncbi:MAG: cytochrome C biogenesis protein [Chitinophagaceae bacterium]
MRNFFVLLIGTILPFLSFAQVDSTAVKWKVTSKKISADTYQLVFSAPASNGWNIYAPNQVLSGVATTTLTFADSAIQSVGGFKETGNVLQQKSKIFEGENERIYNGPTTWTQTVKINGTVPSTLQGALLYTYGKEAEFYQQEFRFAVALEGGISNAARIKISSIDVKHPVANCGDAELANNSLWKLFWIGLGAGVLALLFPCVFPLIPMTVSFFTKRSGSRKKGIMNAFWYGFSIFIIFVLLSLPFHLLNVQPEVLNNISTNVPLNLTFFVFFIAFAISFFGYYEITLPSGLTNKVDSKSGLGDFVGIFFMALTLVIVSFSCTSGILGALLFGALGSQQGAWQLTAGMAGFGIGLGLPFLLFALFPNWLQSLPKSGGWMNELKVVFGFIELAMAVKFLSNADLVKQWGFLKREVFIGIWAIIGIAIVLYLIGLIRFPHDSKPKFTKLRWLFIVIFTAITVYLIPGVTNTRAANLNLISGFPPPLSYSVYTHPVNTEQSIEPMKNDYEAALQLAKQQGKPVLIDFTGWACVNCRKMEENVWSDPSVAALMKEKFIVVSLYVDERKKLPAAQQLVYKTANSGDKEIITVGDKWATFQAENFYAVSQPQYAIISPNEKALTKTKTYTRDPKEFEQWLQCGLNAFKK